MNRFTISQLQQFSGIKSHTIRIWEQRYQAFVPYRTKGNTRYYDNKQLSKLLNIASLLSHNYKISELCSMSDKELNDLIEVHFSQNETENKNTEFYITRIISAALNYDERGVNRILSYFIEKKGIKNTYLELVYPVLLRLGLLWTKGELSPAAEHFFTHLIKRKVITAIENLPITAHSEKWILFLPEDEYHDIGLLLAAYMIKQSGKSLIYLGPNTPLPSVHDAVSETQAQNLLYFLVGKKNLKADHDYCIQTATQFSDCRNYVASLPGRFPAKNAPENLTSLPTLSDLEKILS